MLIERTMSSHNIALLQQCVHIHIFSIHSFHQMWFLCWARVQYLATKTCNSSGHSLSNSNSSTWKVHNITSPFQQYQLYCKSQLFDTFKHEKIGFMEVLYCMDLPWRSKPHIHSGFQLPHSPLCTAFTALNNQSNKMDHSCASATF